MKIDSVEDQLFQGKRQVGRQTGRHDEAFRSFENAPKNVNEISVEKKTN